MSAHSLKDLDDTRRRHPRGPRSRLRARFARVFRRGTQRRHEARLRSNPHLARDIGLDPVEPTKWRP